MELYIIALFIILIIVVIYFWKKNSNNKEGFPYLLSKRDDKIKFRTYLRNITEAMARDPTVKNPEVVNYNTMLGLYYLEKHLRINENVNRIALSNSFAEKLELLLRYLKKSADGKSEVLELKDFLYGQLASVQLKLLLLNKKTLSPSDTKYLADYIHGAYVFPIEIDRLLKGKIRFKIDPMIRSLKK